MGAPWQPGSGSGHNGGMRIEEHIDQLAAEGPRLADAAQRAGLDAAVPGCPGWQVRDLVTHVGGVHRWAASIVGGALAGGDDVMGDRVGAGPADPLLIGWFRDGHRALVQTLRDAPGDLACFTFLPAPSPLAFWARRQAHETAIHRGDAQAACRAAGSFADVTVRGSAADIYLWLWSRPAAVTVTGEAAVADRWQQIRVRWS